jgi:gamma-glutamyltranspeptidase/glutathione hydrolase
MTSPSSAYPPGPQGEFSHRPMVWGTRGMVGGGTQLTAQSGMRILWQGGNAVDAAVAAALAAGVLEATAHYALGGEIALLFYDRASQQVRSVVGQGWAPRAATVDYYLAHWGEIPPGVLSTTVPGVISALLTLLCHYGSMSFGQVAASALDFAHHGFPVYQLMHQALGSAERLANLQRYPDSARIYLRQGGPPALGSLFTQMDLARTLSLMAAAEQQALARGHSREDAIQAARDVFYTGDVAHRMVQALQNLGGLYTMEDFAAYESPLEEPIASTYRGYQIFTNRTWSQGITLLQALNILEGDDLAALGLHSPEAMHLQVEALKLAFADREAYVGDPQHVEVPVQGLLSKAYAALRRGLIDPHKARAAYPPGDPQHLRAVAEGYYSTPTAPGLDAIEDADGTTYLSTVDAEGNMVSATPSSFAGLAQGMILGDTGILINCRGCYFWLDPDNPNAIAPHKRPRTTPCTFLVLKHGQPFMTLGTPGGDSQPQSSLQVFTNLVDFGLNVQEAVEAPRFCSYSFPRSPWPHREYPNRLQVEARMPQGVIETLRDLGHQVEEVGPWGVRNGFAPILVNPETGVYHGGADPRKESVMLGW